MPLVYGFDWSINEIQYQYGDLKTPTFAGGGSANTHIITFQHASGWQLGNNFLFIDNLRDNNSDNFNNVDWYGEFYTSLDLEKLTGQSFKYGFLDSVSLLFGINHGHDPKVLKYLPGIRLSWKVPGFRFLNSDIAAYIDDNEGIENNGAPSEENSFIIDINGAYDFDLGEHKFSLEGHMEYIDSRTNELGNKVHSWILSQIQFRYDLGKQLFQSENHLFVGTEWQFWNNKLGDKETDEHTLQALLVWRF